ncbi:heavy-metal-associated domain-containing protein [Candidatus Parvarchaeota archaeon]|nr:heavy-metal-associated domain-containing protein [Candidatus Parvarchaeota archaeon]
MEKTLKVSGMHCKSCQVLLADIIGEVDGAKALSLDFKTGLVRVSISDESALSKVKEAIKGEGYKVE